MHTSQALSTIQIPKLLTEVKLLRSSLIGFLGKDSEGDYNLEFIEELLENSMEKPIYSFKNKEDFLKSLNE